MDTEEKTIQYKIEAPNEKPSWKEIFRAFPFTAKFLFKTDPFTFTGALLLYLIGAPVVALRLYAIKGVTDALTVADRERVVFWSLVLVGSLAIDAVTSMGDAFFDEAMRFKVGVALYRKIMEVVSKLPYVVMEDPNYRLMSEAINRKAASSLFNIINATFWGGYQFFRIAGSATIFLLVPWQVLLVILVILVIRLVISRYETGWVWMLFTMETRQGRRAHYIERIFEEPSAILPIKSWQLETILVSKWSKIVNDILKEKLAQLKKTSLAYFFADSLRVIGMGFGLFIMVPRALNGETSVGVIVAFLTGFIMILDMLDRLLQNSRMLLRELPFVVVLKQFFTLPKERETGSKIPLKPLRVEFRNVCFRYPGAKKNVINDISFSFIEGDRLAFAGLNGAGKSTLLKLLMGMYEPTGGEILVNGANLRNVKPSEWRKALAVLNQDELNYDDTVLEQIRYGQYGRGVDKNKIQAAIKVSGLGEMIRALPKGVETHAGKTFAMPEDEPVELSGGQRQLLSIARTLYRDARLYIFDEPTSAVDAEKEERFFRKIPTALQGRAVIYVSHRFSVLRQAERIIVIDDGRVIEDGSHGELMEKKGRYAELYELQASAYRD